MNPTILGGIGPGFLNQVPTLPNSEALKHQKPELFKSSLHSVLDLLNHVWTEPLGVALSQVPPSVQA